MKKNIFNTLRFLIGLALFIAGIVILKSDPPSGDNTFHGFLVIAFAAFVVAMTGPKRAPDFKATLKRPGQQEEPLILQSL